MVPLEEYIPLALVFGEVESCAYHDHHPTCYLYGVLNFITSSYGYVMQCITPDPSGSPKSRVSVLVLRLSIKALARAALKLLNIKNYRNKML